MKSIISWLFKYREIKETDEPIVKIVKSHLFNPDSSIIITKSSVGIDLEKNEYCRKILHNSYSFLERNPNK